MPQQDFSTKVSSMIAKVQERMKEVRDEAIQRTIELAQQPVAEGGNMPVDTGFLRSSGKTVTSGTIDLEQRPSNTGTYEWDEDASTLVIQNSKLTDTITFAYAANYAIYQEYGTSRMQGHRFVGLAAQQWPQTVAEAARKVESKYHNGL